MLGKVLGKSIVEGVTGLLKEWAVAAVYVAIVTATAAYTPLTALFAILKAFFAIGSDKL